MNGDGDPHLPAVTVIVFGGLDVGHVGWVVEVVSAKATLPAVVAVEASAVSPAVMMSIPPLDGHLV